MRSNIKHIITFFFIIFFANINYAQDSKNIMVSELKGDSLKVYNLLKKSIKLSAIDSTRIHFFPTINIFHKNDDIYFKTYFYDEKFNNRSSATNYGGLRLKKSHVVRETERYEVAESTEQTIHIPSIFKFSVSFKKEVLFLIESKTPILNTGYSPFIKALFYRGSSKNIVDSKLYTYLPEDSITNDTYYYLCTKDYALLNIKGKYGFIDSSNEIIMPFDKIKITHHKSGFLVTEDSIKYFYDPIKKRKLSKDYDEIAPDKYRTYDKNLLPEKQFSLVVRDGVFNILDSLNNEMLSQTYKSIDYLGVNKKNEFVLLVQNENGNYNLVDLYTQNIIRTERFMQNVGGHLIIKKNKKFGLINAENEILLDIKYDEIVSKSKSIFRLPVRYDDKWALYVLDKFKFMTEFDYSSIMIAGDFMIVSKNKKYGIIDSNGNIKAPIEYDTIIFEPKGGKYETIIYRAFKNKTEEKYNFLIKKIN